MPPTYQDVFFLDQNANLLEGKILQAFGLSFFTSEAFLSCSNSKRLTARV